MSAQRQTHGETWRAYVRDDQVLTWCKSACVNTDLLRSCFASFGRLIGALALAFFCRYALCHAFRLASQHVFRGLEPTFPLACCPLRFRGCLCRFFSFFLHFGFQLLLWNGRIILHVGYV